MFLFETIPWYSWIMFFVVLFGLIFINELARFSKWCSIALFIVLPIILTFTVWTKTAGVDSSVGTWFHWVKVYSALAGCLGFMAIRFIKGASANKLLLMFPPFILALNIFEAVIRDIQVYNISGYVDGMIINGGPWNLMNAGAGILNIITISGWVGIYIAKNRQKDMVWPDMLWFWIIAYDLWNFAYVYNCVPDHSFYAGAALLISCTIPAFVTGKGAWLQHRAQTLAIWMMFVMSFPTFVDSSKFAVQSSGNPTALWIVSGLSLIANIAVFVYHFYKIFKFRRNPVKEEIHIDLDSYKRISA